MKSIHSKSNSRSEQIGIINKVPIDQTNQIVHLKGLFVSRNGTTTYYVAEKIHKPPGFYNKPCKRCGSTNTTKWGKLFNKYQRCDSCEQILGIPPNAKGLGMVTKECIGCGRVNDVKYLRRWHCEDCKVSFLEC